MASRMKVIRWLVILALLCGFGLIIHFGIVAYRVLARMDNMERRSHTLTQVCQAIDIYMDENNGRWPSSWDDLKTIQTKPRGIYDWDTEYDIIQEQVAVDFSADPKSLIDSTWERFDAVQPIGNVYAGFPERSYIPLIEQIEHYHGAPTREVEPAP